ncbi:hypothetical protein ECFRIK1996_4618, partial [Escherichia coli FRIK1996]
MVREFSIQF